MIGFDVCKNELQIGTKAVSGELKKHWTTCITGSVLQNLPRIEEKTFSIN